MSARQSQSIHTKSHGITSKAATAQTRFKPTLDPTPNLNSSHTPHLLSAGRLPHASLGPRSLGCRRPRRHSKPLQGELLESFPGRIIITAPLLSSSSACTCRYIHVELFPQDCSLFSLTSKRLLVSSSCFFLLSSPRRIIMTPESKNQGDFLHFLNNLAISNFFFRLSHFLSLLFSLLPKKPSLPLTLTPRYRALSIGASPNGRYLAIGIEDGSVLIYQAWREGGGPSFNDPSFHP